MAKGSAAAGAASSLSSRDSAWIFASGQPDRLDLIAVPVAFPEQDCRGRVAVRNARDVHVFCLHAEILENKSK
jgi:hypothetical protein